MDDLEKRVQQFKTLQLPGQPIGMHVGTANLVNDLWREVQRLQQEAEVHKGAKEVIDDLKAQLDEAHENLVSMVGQYCVRTVKKTGMPDTYTHMFMSTGEQAFEYLVDHGLAKWCENGIDIYDLKWPSMSPEVKG
jgi:hypothetical protein